MRTGFLIGAQMVCSTIAGLAIAAPQYSSVANPVQISIVETIITNPTTSPNSLKVLFIGNSYTYVNNMPGMLTSLGNSPGSTRQIETTQLTIGGANLEKLWTDSCAQSRIQNTKWDYVVLQEGAPHLIADAGNMAKYVRLFHALIEKSGATTVLFVPWPDKTLRDAQPAMTKSIQDIAKEIGAKVAPIGPAWSIAEGLKPDMNLYQADQRHATPAGSYLAACTFFLMLPDSGKSCPTIEKLDLPPDDLAAVRTAASQSLAITR